MCILLVHADADLRYLTGMLHSQSEELFALCCLLADMLTLVPLTHCGCIIVNNVCTYAVKAMQKHTMCRAQGNGFWQVVWCVKSLHMGCELVDFGILR